MLFSAALLALLPAALATTIRVEVGAGGQLAFNPKKVTAAPGDVLEFHYHPKNHSVQQSSFAAPCKPLEGGFDSGFVPVPVEADAATAAHFSVTVNNTKPIWIYCAQGIHCKSGMSMVINEPAPPSKNTLEAYQLAAKSVNSTAGPFAPVGGVLSNSTSSSSSSVSSTKLYTYTSASTYTSTSAGMATTGVASETVTALSSTAATGTMSSTTSTASTAVSSNGASGPLDVASWAVAAGVVVVGGLVL